MEADSSPILRDLNDRQREAVTGVEGPLMVLAGAGSGKTRVITCRIAHLLTLGVGPEELLAITFTNKAAGEMKERAERLCGLRSPWVTTFHSFAARILRRNIYRLEPYDTSFTICDPDDCVAVVKEVLSELEIDPKLWQPRAVLSEISHLKSRAAGDPDSLGADYRHGQVLRRIYLEYTARMRRENRLDFDDLLLLLVRLWREHPDVLARYRDQFRYVLIDEYQDTNAIQYEIGRLVSKEHGNLCITGDPDQSIYRWRGADIRNILEFERDYPGARVIKLEQNYRSTRNVLRAADALIAHNRERKPKSLWTENEDGAPVEVQRWGDEQEEAREIVQRVKEKLEEGEPAGEVAIFYRINSLSRAIEQELIWEGIPYSIVGGLEFFLRREVKDLLAYLRIVDNPRDSGSLARIVNVPARGVGKGTLEKLRDAAIETRRGLLEVVLDEALCPRLAKRQKGGIEQFRSLWRRLAAEREGPVESLLRQIVEATRYEEHLRSAFAADAQERIANVGELIGAAVEYDQSHPEGSLTGFLELAAILGDVDRWERREDRVSLLTLHSAKGLEFGTVFIAGVEEGLLPLLRASDPDPDIEEERRLLYVGITRSKRHLYLSHTEYRKRFGSIVRSSPSRFLRELRGMDEGSENAFERLRMDHATEESLWSEEADRSRGTFRSRASSRSAEEGFSDGGATGDSFDGDPGPDVDDFFVDPESVPSRGRTASRDSAAWPAGTRVRHEEYGEGRVVSTSGFGNRLRIVVEFENAEEKQFLAAYADLRKVP